MLKLINPYSYPRYFLFVVRQCWVEESALHVISMIKKKNYSSTKKKKKEEELFNVSKLRPKGPPGLQ